MDSRLLMTLQVAVVGVQKIGAVPHGTRVTAPIASGHFEGPRLRGKVLPGGGDWTLLRGDGVLELDLRLTLETDDGALIHMTSFGLRHGPPEVMAALTRRSAALAKDWRRASRHARHRSDCGWLLRGRQAARQGAAGRRRLDGETAGRRRRARPAHHAGDRRRRPHSHDVRGAP